ncbi:MAG: hypothetical protein RBT80_24080, partial [Candidatus Vecturithrix sp.]|nr:hypothetical protein [Candidatus Vecturithrix sp.]
MERATLIIKKTNRGKYIAELCFSDSDKTMPFQDFKPKDDTLNDIEVEVERIDGKIVRVQAGEQLIHLGIAPRASSSRSSQPQHHKSSGQVHG